MADRSGWRRGMRTPARVLPTAWPAPVCWMVSLCCVGVQTVSG
jgi:hypothetical protein